MNRSAIFLCIALFCLAQTVHGGTVYKWRDGNGKWHFSDRVPADQEAEAEETDTSRINTTQGSGTSSGLNRVFPRETPEEAAYRERKAAEARRQRKLIDGWCDEARRRLETVRGRVIFLDDGGNPVNVTEEEREARANDLAGRIKTNCP